MRRRACVWVWRLGCVALGGSAAACVRASRGGCSRASVVGKLWLRGECWRRWAGSEVDLVGRLRECLRYDAVLWLSGAARAEKVDATNARHSQCSPSAHFHLLRGAHSPAHMPPSPSPD